MKDLYYLLIILALIVIFMATSLFAIDAYSNNRDCRIGRQVWCKYNWECGCGSKGPERILPCAMAASQTCDKTQSTAFKKHITKYPQLDPSACTNAVPNAPCNSLIDGGISSYLPCKAE
jgi:hypothetical protein